MIRILLTGKNGQVGRELERTLAPLGEVIALDRSGLDLADPDRIRAAVREAKPGIIVNAAAWTAVDRAESEEAAALAINGAAPGILAEESKRLGALLVHYSTDYVFNGTSARAYTEDDEPNPVGAYGRTKLAGEQAIRAAGGRHLIFRTSWVYGLHGHNFLKTILRLAAERDELRVVADQVGAPTWSRMIAEATALAIARLDGQDGLYHLTAAGETSWHGFAEAILAGALQAGLLECSPPVRRITTADFPTPARRPANSRLDNARLAADFGIALPGWGRQLDLCLGGDQL
ncbi:MAG: dTDP-4-dehydrorhamnose reductase [Candidatus Nitricoxidivorans perseverans]|uniref:dTDP-4-dehydrorhamnose reductase n=1 Tax=Candidatus Nitricoxidivorans perseverans TaxID=2975601 RepID=A0AA49FNP5_9PROT|nr:MAG: dTDP-4-dehydrorhamnose reductase [Candidatus Nitricoxidivorans perseverans]